MDIYMIQMDFPQILSLREPLSNYVLSRPFGIVINTLIQRIYTCP